MKFSGHIGGEPFEGTIEEWACRVGGVVVDERTISIDLNKPMPFGSLERATVLRTRLGSERPVSWTATQVTRKRVCAGALRSPVVVRKLVVP